MNFHLSRTQAKISNQKGGKSHCKQSDFVKLSCDDPTPLGSTCNLKKRQLFYTDIETQLKSNICQLVNTGKQSWQKGKKKRRRKKRKGKEIRILQIEIYPQKLQFGILPTKQESMWELNSARKGDTLCILDKYKVNRNYNLFMRFYRVQTRLKV